ncbi:MAG: hydrogenase [Verrucomicrobiae bacterium]|nr:hydrogenase [Verrucomicrobiae bacterium]
MISLSQTWMDGLLVMLMLTNLILLGASRLGHGIRLIAIQGALLGALPILGGQHGWTARMLFLAVITIGLKAVVFPWFLHRALRAGEARREDNPFVGHTASVLAGLVMLTVATCLSARLPTVGAGHSMLVMPVALFMILTGPFLITSRRKALSQILGYVVLENGMYAFGLVMLQDVPALVELGILLDAFVALFVMGAAVHQINREFDHMDADQLDSLKG